MVAIIPAADVPTLLPMGVCIAEVETALIALKEGRGDMPLRFGYKMPLGGKVGILASMPAYAELEGKAYCSNKVITVYPANKADGLESHQGAILLYEAEHGRLLAMVDASTVTAIRTAAASAVATKLLAPNKPSMHLALIGAGTLAATHLEAMIIARPTISKVTVYNRSAPSLIDFIEKAKKKYEGIEFVAVDTVHEAAREADIVCTLTPATEPVLFVEDVKKGAHINAVGACTPAHCEIDPELVKVAKLFADSTESCTKEPGDIVRPIQAGLITTDHVVAELGDLLTKRKEKACGAEDITLFESLGLAIEDLVCSVAVYKRYSEAPAECSGVCEVAFNPTRE